MGKQTQWSNDYAKRAYDRISLFVAKGEKDKIKAHAKSAGYDSLNAYINDLIESDMQK